MKCIATRVPKYVKQFSSEPLKNPIPVSLLTVFFVASAAATVSSGLVWFVGNYSETKKIVDDVMITLPVPIHIDTSYKPNQPCNTYVNRSSLEDTINLYMLTKGQGWYFLVYGAKGAGKSELVERCATGKSGVVKLTVTTASTKADVISELLAKIVGVKDLAADMDLLVAAIQKCDHTPTIIMEVERGAVQSVRSVAKFLATSCAVVVVLSEGNAILEFGADRHREEYLFVGELDRAEAKQLLHNLGATFTEAEMDFVFTNIGTLPAMLKMLVGTVLSSSCTLEKFVANKLDQAAADLTAFRHQLILDELKKQPGGVHVKQLAGKFHEGVNLAAPREVCVAMKNSNAIVYRMESREYQLLTTAHRTALLGKFKPLAKA